MASVVSGCEGDVEIATAGIDSGVSKTGGDHLDTMAAIVEVLTKRMLQGMGCRFVLGQVGSLGVLLENLVHGDSG